MGMHQRHRGGGSVLARFGTFRYAPKTEGASTSLDVSEECTHSPENPKRVEGASPLLGGNNTAYTGRRKCTKIAYPRREEK